MSISLNPRQNINSDFLLYLGLIDLKIGESEGIRPIQDLGIK